jgi:hypothetical protein
MMVMMMMMMMMIKVGLIFKRPTPLITVSSFSVIRRFVCQNGNGLFHFFQTATPLNLPLCPKFPRTLDMSLIQVCPGLDPIIIVTISVKVEELNFLQVYKAFVSVSEYVSYMWVNIRLRNKNSAVVHVELKAHHTLFAFRGLSWEGYFSEI